MTANIVRLGRDEDPPPCDPDAEAAVLSALLLSSKAFEEVGATLESRHFYAKQNSRVYEAVLELRAQNRPIDTVSVATYLRDHGRLDQIGGTPYLAKLVDATPAVAHVEEHARSILDKWWRRSLIATFKRGEVELKTGGATPEEVIESINAIAKPTQGVDGLGPMVDNPLRGLRHLGPIAVLGADRLKALAAEPIDYAWNDIAVQGTVTVLAGKPGGGKTTALFLILAARASNEERFFLGRAVRPAGEGKFIVLIEGEHSEGSAARKLLRSARIMDVEPEALGKVILVARKAVRLGSPEWADVVRLVSAGLVSDIALDTLARVAPANADNEAEQVAIFDSIAQAIEAGPDGAKPNVWVVAHTRKSGEGESLDEVSGSAQRVGQADTVIILTASRDGGRVVSTKAVFAKLREEPEEYPLPVSFSLEGDELSLDAPRGEDKRPLEEQIVDLLKSGPKTKNAIRDALGRSGTDVEEAISNLFDTRTIRSTYVTLRGVERKAFEVVQ